MRHTLPDNRVSEAAQRAIETFHSDIVKEVQAAIQNHRVVVVGMQFNPYVRKAQTLLRSRGIEFHYLGYGGYLSQWKQRLAIKLWSGWPTYPQIFVEGRLIGGYKELQQLR
jgi:glutaredoxin-related protein